jgi:nicotinate-nucleotide adenylyltransferase
MSGPVRWNQVTALFGGAFDPPHIGHREAVRGLFHVPGVRDVVILPTGTPPHKYVNTPSEHRLEMARLNFADFLAESHSPVRLDDREIHRLSATGRPSYTYDTLMEFRRETHALAFVIGTDQLLDLPNWYRFPEILDLCHWIVLERKTESPEKTEKAHRLIASLGKSMALFPTEAPAISSTVIRENIARTGNTQSDSLLPSVAAYLKQWKLYGT